MLDYTRAKNFGGVSLNSSMVSGETMPLLTLDDLQLECCHLIKIDVEGMEGEVLKGARQTIQRFRPVLYVENDREEKSSAFIEQIQRLGYRLWEHTPPLFNPKNFARNRENLFSQIRSVNMLCLPQEIELTVKSRRARAAVLSAVGA